MITQLANDYLAVSPFGSRRSLHGAPKIARLLLVFLFLFVAFTAAEDERLHEPENHFAINESEKDFEITNFGKTVRCPTRQSLEDSQKDNPFFSPVGDDQTDDKGNIYIAGLVLNIAKIRPQTVTWLLDLNCHHHVGVHALSGGGKEIVNKASEIIDEIKLRCFPDEKATCATFQVEPDPPGIRSTFPNRVDRIAYLRDYQRELLRTQFIAQDQFPDVVVLADLDLYGLPDIPVVRREIHRVAQSHEHDVICAAGLMHNPFGYYDIFATVLMPNTFVYPLRGRKVPEMAPDEDQFRIRSDEIYGELTQAGMFRDLLEKGRSSPTGTVQVRSCFGGLVIYRASVWFQESCQYSMAIPHSLEIFSSLQEGRPCEHVVFHDCILKANASTNISVMPTLNTFWDKPTETLNYLFAGGKIFDGLKDHHGLVTPQHHPEHSMQLKNGKFSFKIDRYGSLRVDAMTSDGSKEVIWKLDSNSTLLQDKWEYMFLTLEEDGELVLSQQIQNNQTCSTEDYFHSMEGSSCRPCRYVVWSSNVRGDSDMSDYFLHLGHDGILRVVDLSNARVLWQNVAGNSNSQVYTKALEDVGAIKSSSSARGCIPSGDQDSINKVLSLGRFSEAVLCPGAIFELSSPIFYTDSHQAIYTQGRPTGEGRAVLKVVDASIATAVNMVNHNNAELSHVTVDGNRPILGKTNTESYRSALILGGGNCRRQIIRHIHAYEPRTWSTLHLIEGGTSSRCKEAIIEHNRLGPAGLHYNGAWSDGLSMACMKSIVRGNTIVDATDVSLVLFGAPGTIVENNIIVARNRSVNAGISLVDYAPFDGNFSGSIIQNNTIDAENAAMGVGIAMGPRIWHCIDDKDIKELQLWGGTVVNNTLKGNLMQYGFAVDGVRDWTVRDNTDEASHIGEAVETCNGLVLSAPKGFQINRRSSFGDFQEEFEDAQLCDLVHSFETKNLEAQKIHEEAKFAFPCYPQSDASSGFFFVKIPKTAGTTVAGVARRVLAKKRKEYGINCSYRGGHATARALFKHERLDSKKSFLMTFVREPAERELSSFFYHAVSKHNVKASGARFVEWSKQRQGNKQLDHLSLTDGDFFVAEKIQEVLDSFDFIGITERMEESLVVLAMLLGLDVDEILFMNAKHFGYAFTTDSQGNNKCVKMIPKQNFAEARAYFQSADWRSRNLGDIALYRSANRSLDSTIESLGRKRFEHNLASFRSILRFAQERCTPTIRSPCSSSGLLQINSTNCYGRDEGCGFPCLDEVVVQELQNARESINGDILPAKCIPSGNQDLINRALAGRFAEAVLCPGAVFDLILPIQFTDAYQSIHTQGRPTDDTRAILRIADEAIATAVIMSDYDYAELSHVIIDGNRPALGTDLALFREALVKAGGTSQGQVIRHIDVFEPRTWTALHVAEGDPSNRCKAATIENNSISRLGQPLPGKKSDGLSIACTMSTIRNNSITDATGVSIVLFGAPGSVVEDNRITAQGRPAMAGITLVHYIPYEGSFEGSVVQRNVINAKNATIRIAVAMGPRVWKCMSDTELGDHLLWGASVIDNVMTGDFMQYGFAIDGVRNWTVRGNVDKAQHVGGPYWTCAGMKGSKPEAFQINLASSSGLFQDEFRSAVISNAVANDGSQHFETSLELTWLMSFPNSGTTYSLEVISNISSISAATNYGMETTGKLLAFAATKSSGPFWLREDLEHPTNGMILTKTHCGGYGHRVRAHNLLISKPSFLRECLVVQGSSNRKVTHYYELDHVKRVIHLIRDPFDNIVSRFHHERQNAMSEDERLVYPESLSGFRSFCRDKIDHRYWRRDFNSPVNEEIWTTLNKVPCHTDFLRYINWHNHAFQVADDLQLPSLVVQYERYGTHWNETVSSILNFLEYSAVRDFSGTFKAGKNYRHFFEVEDVNVIRSSFKKIASEKTWSSIKHYFEDVDLPPSTHLSPKSFEKQIKSFGDKKEHAGSSSSPPCDYQELMNIFGTRDTISSENCWRVEEASLMIPLEEIGKTEDLEVLGVGSNGIVHRAQLQLGKAGPMCSVAVKTPLCKDTTTHGTKVSCVDAKAFTNEEKMKKFAESEYLGALLFSLVKKGRMELRGLLPTWGLLYSNSSNSIAGSILPIIQMDPIMDVVTNSPLDVAKMMLPVVEALSFVEEIGFSFQDVHRKNIGVAADGNAIFYDNSYLSFLGDGVCSSRMSDEACNFCRGEKLRSTPRRPHMSNRMIRAKDCRVLVVTLISLLPPQAEFAKATALFIELDILLYGGGECTMKNVMEVLKKIVQRPCIPSGNQDAINKALSARNEEAVLCPKAVFELTAPVKFQRPYQSVYTQGRPTGSDKAVLRIVSDELATAVKMTNQNYAELSHVKVDGNRPSFGMVLKENLYNRALIEAGGASQGQTIRHVEMYEPRSWSALDLASGKSNNRCHGALVEFNKIEVAGTANETKDSKSSHYSRSNGLTISCSESIVRQNTIVDATDAGVVMSGAQGSFVEDNTIIARTREANFGVLLMDTRSCYSDFTGCVIRRNIINAENAKINTGLLLGSRSCGCMDKEEGVTMDHKARGAFVIDNTVLGNEMVHGFAIDGVRNCTVKGNIANLHFSETMSLSGDTVPLVDAFQINWDSSSGAFQKEFHNSQSRPVPPVCKAEKRTDGLQVALLISFPNSGTSYTLRNARRKSLISFASNYGAEVLRDLSSIYKSDMPGPFWVCCSSWDRSVCEGLPLDKPKPPFCRPCPFHCVKEGTILTKTHCGGYDIHASWPSKEGFVKECLTTFDANGKMRSEYSGAVVKRFVHLIRDPFDNIVSRFRHERTNSMSENDRDIYENTPAGFRLFCHDKIDDPAFREIPGISQDLWNRITNIPCHVDFLRYINWHNLAFEMVSDSKKPSLLIHYEQYSTEWNTTVTNLLDFLGQSATNSTPLPFSTEKTYRNYYQAEEIDLVKLLCFEMSSKQTWSNIGQYFIDDGSAQAMRHALIQEDILEDISSPSRLGSIDPSLNTRSAPSNFIPNPQQVTPTNNSRLKKLPFIFGAAMSDLLLESDPLILLGINETALNVSEISQTLYLPSKTDISGAGANSNTQKPLFPWYCPDAMGMIHVKFSSSPHQKREGCSSAAPDNPALISSPGVYTESNGTKTLVLDTCTPDKEDATANLSSLTIIQGQGCTGDRCESWSVVGEENFLPIPKHCSLSPEDPFFACPCNVEHPTIWYDKPLQKWRMLVHQYPSLLVDGKCTPMRDYNEYAGGYAESFSQSVAGPWLYDYFRPAYGNSRRVQFREERVVNVVNHSRRESPRVILDKDGGLDGGSVVNAACYSDHYDTKNNCGIAVQPVVRSTTKAQHRTNGTIYLVYHAETVNGTSPLGIGPTGLQRAHYLSSIIGGRRFPNVPQTIIASQNRDAMGKGQRMRGTVTPLAEHLGIDITTGPLLLDDPFWSYHPAAAGARQALESLANGTVLISWWSYVEEFCKQLGTSCDKFVDPGEMIIFEVKEGEVISQERTTDGFAINYRWEQLPSRITTALEILGYNDKMWDMDQEPECYLTDWADLHPAERCAASALGFDEEKWERLDEIPLDIASYGGVSNPYLDKESEISVLYDDLPDASQCLELSERDAAVGMT